TGYVPVRPHTFKEANVRAAMQSAAGHDAVADSQRGRRLLGEYRHSRPLPTARWAIHSHCLSRALDHRRYGLRWNGVQLLRLAHDKWEDLSVGDEDGGDHGESALEEHLREPGSD